MNIFRPDAALERLRLQSKRPVRALLGRVRAHRHEIRTALEAVPVVGPLAISAVRAGRRALAHARDRRSEIPPGRFLELYKARTGIADLGAITDPVQRMHTDFALSTVKRGRYARDRIAEHTSIRGKRYLDVGCAYGGFLVAFAEAGASRVVGIDINRTLLDYAEALTADHGVRAEIYELDILSTGPTNGAPRPVELAPGSFDLITCNDVIEHVLDPAAALARLVGLLADGGMLYMEIPNRFHAPFVLADGHFQIFGITTLPKKLADGYFQALNPGKVHDVTYESLPFYVNTLAKLGATAQLISYFPADVPGHLESIGRTFEACEQRVENGLNAPPATARALERTVRRTTRTFRREHARYVALRDRDPAAARKVGERLCLAFGTGFWTLLIQKDAGARAKTTSWSKGLRRGQWASTF